ncbi:MAG: ferritin-like domain-containing protein [Bacteroidetes bacterium]|nr:ferritin-like domain-containing protein [Bacteroidota bacterium]
MNLFNIIQRLGEVSTSDLLKLPNVEHLSKETRSSGKVSASSFSNVSAISDVLNFALKLEYLESAFYTQGVSSGVIPAADIAIFQQIKKHENAHVAFLQSTITSLGATPITSPNFDFTAAGAFNPFTVYGDFLALSQAFEDTGVRAYKGQAGNLITDNTVLTAALQIHSVEARHASEVRRLRNKNGMDASAKGWISGNSRGTLPAATQAIYNGEDNTTQGTVNVTTVTNVGTAAIQEAFDEPLTDTMVLSIVQPFIV